MKVNKRDLIIFHSKARLESETARYFAGYLWWILDPVFSALIYYLVFQIILHRGGPDYMPFLIVGLIPWKWFQTSTQSASMSIHGHKKLYTQVYLPKDIFPWIEVTFHTVKFLVVFSVMVLIYALVGYPLTLNHCYLPVLIIVQYCFIIGLNMFLASFTPFFPDFNMVISHLLRLLLYPSGILFSLEHVPAKYRFLIDYNPVALAVDNFRRIILHGEPPSFRSVFFLLAVGGIGYLLGRLIIDKLDKKYAKYVG